MSGTVSEIVLSDASAQVFFPCRLFCTTICNRSSSSESAMSTGLQMMGMLQMYLIEVSVFFRHFWRVAEIPGYILDAQYHPSKPPYLLATMMIGENCQPMTFLCNQEVKITLCAHLTMLALSKSRQWRLLVSHFNLCLAILLGRRCWWCSRQCRVGCASESPSNLLVLTTGFWRV